MYPANWPKCACGEPVLDGHLTCGRVECDEGGARRARQTAFQSLNTGVCGNCGEEVTFDLHDRDVCSPLRTFTRGDKVWWRRVASGGYGFAERVPAVVIRTTDKRVVIDAELQTGGYKRVAVRWRNVEARS